MAGLTYPPFRPRDFCYVVVYTYSSTLCVRSRISGRNGERSESRSLKKICRQITPSEIFPGAAKDGPIYLRHSNFWIQNCSSAASYRFNKNQPKNRERNYLVVHSAGICASSNTKQMREQIEQAGKQIEKLGKMNKSSGLKGIRGLEEKLELMF